MAEIDLKKLEAEGFKDHDEEDQADGEDQKVGSIVDLMGDGGVMKKLLVAGEGWEQPQKDDKVTVHYTGRLVDGTKFDSSVDRNDPFEFNLGTGSVIRGWDVAVNTMKKGEKVEVTLAPDYGYGANGSPPKIPPAATLVFEIELISWISLNDLSPERNGSILKFMVEEGDPSKWDKPRAEDIVTIAYTANVFGVSESFTRCEGAEFKVGDGHFCPAVGIAVQEIKHGDQIRLKVGPKYAFGAAGCAGCPPDSTIEIHMHLMKVKTVKNVDPDKTGSIVKTILEDGRDYKTPNENSKVKVSWTGCLADGTQFDKVDNVEVHTMNDEFPCDGLEMAVMSMKASESAEVVIKDPSFAFGSEGLSGKVPANAPVTYAVQLHEIANGKETFELDNFEKFALAEKRKLQGNNAFKKGKWESALSLYGKAEIAVSMDKDFDEEQKVKIKALKQSCSLNLAATCLKLHKFPEAISHASKVLASQPGNVKALYRRCQAYTETGDFVEAESDIKSALLESPNSKDLQMALKALKKKIKADSKRSTKLYGAMFSKVGDIYDAVPVPAPASGVVEGALPEYEMEGPGDDQEVTGAGVPDVEMEAVDDNEAGPVTDAIAGST